MGGEVQDERVCPETAETCGPVGNNHTGQTQRPRFLIVEYADVCPTTSWGTARGAKTASDFGSRRDGQRQLGKTRSLTVRGGEVTADAARGVGKQPTADFAMPILVRPIYIM